MSSQVILNYDWEIFLSKYPNLKNYECKSIMAKRDTILKMFYAWGFGDWNVFSRLILHFYPQVSEKELFELYEGSVIRQDVLKYVYYVYLIFQK